MAVSLLAAFCKCLEENLCVCLSGKGVCLKWEEKTQDLSDLDGPLLFSLAPLLLLSFVEGAAGFGGLLLYD